MEKEDIKTIKNENELVMIPYVMYENAITRLENQMKATHKRDSNIIMTLLITLLLVIGIVLGGVIYFFTQYDFVSYEQVITGENIGGNQTIEDGIHINNN